jgi:hypothetical protein
MITASVTTKPIPTYVGQTWYDFMGQMIDETGHSSPHEAAKRIAATDKALAGRWCFAVIKTKVVENNVERWVNVVIFPDGKTRKLVQGEVSLSQSSSGRFISLEALKNAAEVAKLKLDIRAAPDMRFPWKGGAAETGLLKFTTMVEVEKWLLANHRPDSIVFLFTPGSHVRPPDEEMLFAYLAILPV